MAAQQRLVRVSASKLSTWLDCPRRFLLTYVERGPRGSWAHLSYGNAIHLALRDAYGDEESSDLSSQALIDRHWRADGFRDEQQAEQWRAEAVDLVERYRAAGPGRVVHSTERTLGARTDRIVIDARVDRIDRIDHADGSEELVIVDYKTGRRPSTETEARTSIALAFYATAAQQSLRRSCATVELHHLPSGERVAWTHDEASLARHLTRAEEIAMEMQQAIDSYEGSDGSAQARDALFPPRPGPLCGWCDAHAACADAWGSPKEPWAGLASGMASGAASSVDAVDEPFA